MLRLLIERVKFVRKYPWSEIPRISHINQMVTLPNITDRLNFDTFTPSCGLGFFFVFCFCHEFGEILH